MCFSPILSSGESLKSDIILVAHRHLLKAEPLPICHQVSETRDCLYSPSLIITSPRRLVLPCLFPSFHDLELLVFLPPPPECWGCCQMPYQAQHSECLSKSQITWSSLCPGTYSTFSRKKNKIKSHVGITKFIGAFIKATSTRWR